MAATEVEKPVTSQEVDEVITQMENLYRAVTGTSPPAGDAAYAPIPVEKDAGQHVEEQLGRLLSTLEMLGMLNVRTRPLAAFAAAFTPPMTVLDGEREIVVRVDLPGVARNDVEVSLRGATLTVSGVRRPELPADQRVRVMEPAQGTFVRRLLVPPNALANGPRATLRDGVLEIRLSRQAETATAVPIA